MFNAYRVSVLQGEKVLEMGCTRMGRELTLLNCILKNGQDGKFYVTCILLKTSVFKALLFIISSWLVKFLKMPLFDTFRYCLGLPPSPHSSLLCLISSLLWSQVREPWNFKAQVAQRLHLSSKVISCEIQISIEAHFS